jgi:hypothetical protein
MTGSVLNLNRQTIHEILTFEQGMQKMCQAGPELGMPKICAKLVPKIRTNEQKE